MSWLKKKISKYFTFLSFYDIFMENLLNWENQKIADPEFLNDTKYILRPTEKYDPEFACELVKKELIEKI